MDDVANSKVSSFESFSLFLRLPDEMQSKIWAIKFPTFYNNLNLEQPRVYRVTLKQGSAKAEKYQVMPGKYLKKHSADALVLASIGRKPRKEVRRVLPDLFSVTVDDGFVGIPFNSKRDIVFLDTNFKPGWMERCSGTHLAGFHDKISNLALGERFLKLYSKCQFNCTSITIIGIKLKLTNEPDNYVPPIWLLTLVVNPFANLQKVFYSEPGIKKTNQRMHKLLWCSNAQVDGYSTLPATTPDHSGVMFYCGRPIPDLRQGKQIIYCWPNVSSNEAGLCKPDEDLPKECTVGPHPGTLRKAMEGAIDKDWTYNIPRRHCRALRALTRRMTRDDYRRIKEIQVLRMISLYGGDSCMNKHSMQDDLRDMFVRKFDVVVERSVQQSS